MSNIFKIQEEYLQLMEVLIENGGELTPEIETSLQITEKELQEKAIGYSYVIKQLDSDVDVIDSEIKRLTDLKKSRNNAKERLKDTLKNAMITCGIEEIKSATLKINFRKSESTEIENEALIPAFYWVTKEVRTIDKAAIKKDIKFGLNIPGAYISENKNIQIK
jgi:hypothetical protein